MGPTWLDLELARLDAPEDDDAFERAAALLASSPQPTVWRRIFDRCGAVGGAALLVAGVVYLVAFNWAALGPWSKLSVVAGALALCALVGLVLGNRRLVGSAALAAAGGMVGPLLAVHSQAYQSGADAWTLFAWWFVLFVPWAVLSRRTGVWLGALVLLQTAVATGVEQYGGDLSLALLGAGSVAMAWWAGWMLILRSSVYPKVAATLGWLALLGASWVDLAESLGRGHPLGLASWVLVASVVATQVVSLRGDPARRDLYLVSGSAAVLCAWVSSRLLYLLVTWRVGGLGLFFSMGLAVLLQAAALAVWIRWARGGDDELDA